MKEIVEVIKNGGVVIMPTDTIYGIVADATNEKAIQKVYEMKKRNDEISNTDTVFYWNLHMHGLIPTFNL